MKEEIKTFEELWEYNGRKITCNIYDTDVKNCLVSIAGSKVYLLQNEKDGQEASDLKGYEYSWVVTRRNFYLLSDIYPIERTSLNIEVSDCLVSIEDSTRGSDKDEPKIEQPKYYYKDSPKKPIWFDGRPVLVHYSDESEEDAIESDNIGWLLEVYTDPTDYPFKIATEHSTLEDSLNFDMDSDDYGDYTYVVPVVRENEELKALRKQREEIDAKIELLEGKE